MEHNSTDGSKKNVPGQRSSQSDTDLLRSFGIEVPDFISIPEMQSPKFTDISSDLQRKADRMMEEARRETERLFAESSKWLEEGRLKLEKERSDMDFKEYVDSDGYQVVEGRSKSGYVVIQRMKKNGNQFISKMEIYKDGELTFKSSSNEEKYSYRDNTGRLVEVERSSRTEKDRTPKGKRVSWEGSYGKNVHLTPHAKVVKGKKKSTKRWKWLFVLAIAALVIYFFFLR